jgi:hypothetical protein
MAPHSSIKLIVALSIAWMASNASAQPPPGQTCGMIGCTQHGDGDILSKDNDGKRIVVEFEVGDQSYAPYARERLTLAPELRRKGNVLIVEYHAKGERLAARIPGGLGAFWEIDLNNEESSLLKKLYLDLGGQIIEPTGSDGSHAEFEVGADSKGPYTLIFRVGFFGTTEDIRITKETRANSRSS